MHASGEEEHSPNAASGFFVNVEHVADYLEEE